MLDSPDETCDDGNQDSGDGCDPMCQTEPGFVCDPTTGYTPTPCHLPGEAAPAPAEDTAVPTEDGGDYYDPAWCPDGYLDHAGETCDDGNNVAGDGCDAMCQVEYGWFCEPSPDGPTVCHPESEEMPEDMHYNPVWCPDGMLDHAGETCDDGNSDAGDGCDPTCQVEEGWHCDITTGYTPTTCFMDGDDETSDPYYNPDWCPDSMLDHAGETCDDGNDMPGDGCDPHCHVEPGWFCEETEGFNPTYCYQNVETFPGPDTGAEGLSNYHEEWCGDGMLDHGGETCDDGNRDSGDGCDPTCHVEPGWMCEATGGFTPTPCVPAEGEMPPPMPMPMPMPGDEIEHYNPAWCPDSMLDHSGETCDDGNDMPGDGCDPTCHVEPGWFCEETQGYNPTPCHPEGAVPPPPMPGMPIVEVEHYNPAWCPDSMLDSIGETCDDGNDMPGDGCDPTCHTEPGWFCEETQGYNPTPCYPEGTVPPPHAEFMDTTDIAGAPFA